MIQRHCITNVAFLSPCWWNWRSGGHRSTCGIGSFGSDMFPFSAASRHGKLGAARYFQIFWAGRFIPVTTHHWRETWWTMIMLTSRYYLSYARSARDNLGATFCSTACAVLCHFMFNRDSCRNGPVPVLSTPNHHLLRLGIGSGIFLCCTVVIIVITIRYWYC